MTTATAMKTRKKSDIKLCGSGLICIKKTVDPELVYDIDGLDYVRLLRGQGCLDSDLYDYVEDELEKIGTDSLQPDLNYPSFKAHLYDQKTSQVFRMRLKGVGFEEKMQDKVYKAYVTKCPKGAEITVKPRN
ncbi:hypothetical protein RHMOL_Rhmol13G0298700 [Rhododendron molle]|uniref:Uncharacterized protein n=1 Tax=Rhododendron molle TaxID=49168 RepID=A0ACC0LDA3_RHOML|nr:hypothetical protein RHMOL_Rhmol13G0298700 [Rhododendron molle]